MKIDYQTVWTEVGRRIACGEGVFTRGLLDAVYCNLDISKMKSEYLPGINVAEGTEMERKIAIFNLAGNLWGLTPNDWLVKEKFWLDQSREVTGSSAIAGKDKVSDVISAELLIRIIAAAKLANDNLFDRDEIITSLNAMIVEVCTKGRTRMKMRDGRSLYSILKDGGLMIGSGGGGGKYLPYPEKSLPELLMLLRKDVIRPEAYEAYQE